MQDHLVKNSAGGQHGKGQHGKGRHQDIGVHHEYWLSAIQQVKQEYYRIVFLLRAILIVKFSASVSATVNNWRQNVEESAELCQPCQPQGSFRAFPPEIRKQLFSWPQRPRRATCKIANCTLPQAPKQSPCQNACCRDTPRTEKIQPEYCPQHLCKVHNCAEGRAYGQYCWLHGCECGNRRNVKKQQCASCRRVRKQKWDWSAINSDLDE